ncbi:MAG: hypothetical protein WC508_00450 [Patescibacteria group bacterium]
MTNKKVQGADVKHLRKKRAKKGVNPDKFLEVMARLEAIDVEIKNQEMLHDAKIKSLELEKQYLWEMIQPK